MDERSRQAGEAARRLYDEDDKAINDEQYGPEPTEEQARLSADRSATCCRHPTRPAVARVTWHYHDGGSPIEYLCADCEYTPPKGATFVSSEAIPAPPEATR